MLGGRERERLLPRCAALIATIAVVELGIALLVLPGFDPEKSPRPIAQGIARATAPGERVAAYGLEPIEGALFYYGGVRVESIDGESGFEGIEDFLAGGGKWVLLRARHFESQQERLGLARHTAFRDPPRQLVLAERIQPSPFGEIADDRTEDRIEAP